MENLDTLTAEPLDIQPSLKKKWSQNGSNLELFSLIIMFEKKTVPLTKVVPFAKTAPQWSRFP